MAKTARPLRRAPELVVLGHVTRDLITGHESLGGAAAFAARAASCFGVRTGVVTAAPPDFELLRELTRDPNVEVRRARAEQVTTFALDYSGPVRSVRLLHRAPPLAPADLPAAWRAPSLAYVAPVCGECPRRLVTRLAARALVVGAQGWLRGFARDGRVVPRIRAEALRLPSGILALVFSELDHPAAEALAVGFARQVPVVALTRGGAGATLLVGGVAHSIRAAPAVEVDPTGAGDVFGLVLGLALRHGLDPLAAARLAALAAARVVEGPGVGALPEFCMSPAWRKVVAA